MLNSAEIARPLQVASNHSWVASENSDKPIESVTARPQHRYRSRHSWREIAPCLGTGQMLAHAGSLKALGFNDSGTKSFWRDFFAKAFHPYRPEMHYMRGPGPAWRAKYGEAAYRLKCRATCRRLSLSADWIEFSRG